MLKKNIIKSDFTRNALTLMTGTTIAQSIPIAITPVLTRIYSPEDFGLFALYMSIFSIVAIMATGRYELAIVLPKKNKDAAHLVILSLLITILISLVTLIVILLYNSEITQFLENQDISNWLYLLPVSVLVTGVYQSMNYWSNRKKQYRRLALSKILQTGTTATTNLGMGFSGYGSGGLILGSIVGQGVSAWTLRNYLLKEDRKYFQKISALRILYLLKKYKKLPMYNLPNSFIEALRLSVVNIVIARLFTSSVLGQFSLAWRMLQVPMALIGNSLSQVFYQKISSAERSDLNLIVKKFIFRTSLLISPIFIIIFLFSEDVFVFVFGENWQLAGKTASILTPWLFFAFLVRPLAAIFVVINRQEIALMFSTINIGFLFGTIALFRHSGFIELLGYITFVMSVMLLIYIFIVLLYSNKTKTLI